MFLLNQGCLHSLCLLRGLQCSSKLIMKPIVKAELLGLPTGMLSVNVHIAGNDFEMQSGQTDSLAVCPSMALSGFTTQNFHDGLSYYR